MPLASSFITFQFGDFPDSGPDWFDFVSLFLTLLGILAGFLSAKYVYSKEKRDKEIEECESLNAEIKLFKNSLKELKIAINEQIQSIENYKKAQNKLKINLGIQIDFISSINLRYLYKERGLDNDVEIARLNSLFSNLYTLKNLSSSLRNEVDSYLRNYSFKEDKFHLYRKLLYTKYNELSNLRGFDFKGNFFKLDEGDSFMIEYTKLRESIFTNGQIFNNNELIDRQKLIENFISPLLKLSFNHIPQEQAAIEISDLANEILVSFNDMQSLTHNHFSTIESCSNVLKIVKQQIDEYLIYKQ